jgi:hypothetical protein
MVQMLLLVLALLLFQLAHHTQALGKRCVNLIFHVYGMLALHVLFIMETNLDVKVQVDVHTTPPLVQDFEMNILVLHTVGVRGVEQIAHL